MYQVYSITTPDNKYRYYGTTKNLKERIRKHVTRFNCTAVGCDYPVYNTLRLKVDSLRACEIKVIKEFNEKIDARLFEQKMIEKDGNLNTINAVA